MKLKTPNVAILANLAMDFMAIGSAEYADFLLKKGTPEQFDQAPVGTGPFSFVAYQKDSVIRYKANKDYYGEKPLVDDLVFAITPDATARYAKLKAGECHVNAYPRPADLAEMEKDPALKVIHASGLNILFWAFDVAKPPLDKKEVRQALAMSIDRDAIMKDVFLGAGEKATTLIPPTMWSYDDKIPDVPYDPEKAKAMLAAAGVQTPLEIDLWYQPVSRPYNPNGKRIGEMMQADLAKIGVNAKLVTYEWGEYRKRAQGGEDMTAQLGWTGDNGDPDNFFFLDSCVNGKPINNNIPKWCNAEFNDLLVKARVVSDQAERAKLYQRMQEIEHDEQPELLVAHSIVYESMRSNVTGYKQSPLGTHAFEGVDLQ
jgi:dipeptide transport system substrate-binding protein